MNLSQVIFTSDFSVRVDVEREAKYKKQSPIETATVDFLASLSVRVDVSQAGENINRDGWTCDGWRVTFWRGKTRESFDYFTGTGHRVNPYKKGHFLYSTHKARPVLPHVAGVLACLLADSEVSNLSFSDWCDAFGFDSDSIKAFNTYRQCEESAKKFISLFGRENVQKLRDILSDY